jgi:hybrid cluster-associated redox disulfide protein
MARITKDTLISDILQIAPQSAQLFMSIGMHCLGCAMASGETLEQACAVHGVDIDAFIEELNNYTDFVGEDAVQEIL